MTTSAGPSPAPAPSRAYWLCQLGGWGANALLQVGLLSYLPVILVIGVVTLPGPQPLGELPYVPAGIAIPELLALNGGGLLLTHLLRRWIHAHRWAERHWPALTWRVLLSGLLLGAPLGMPQHFLAVAALNQLPGAPAWLQMLQHSVNWAGLIWLWQVVYFIVAGQRRRRREEQRQSEVARALQAAELRLLKSQLNPHFLFNSLNSVRALIADDPRGAQDAITQLARTLRYTLAPGQDELVTLERELEMVDDYLALEALRLGERLKVERAIDDAARHARIPVMLLQTLVENAIKHGIAELPEGGVLRLVARLRDAQLSVEVENPRPDTTAIGEGVGLNNSRERLRLLFGARAGLSLDLADPRRAVAHLIVPAAA